MLVSLSTRPSKQQIVDAPEELLEKSVNMEAALKVFEQLNRKAEAIQEAMIIIPKKAEFAKEFGELSEKDKEVKSLEANIQRSVSDHNEMLKKEYDTTVEFIKRVQLKMMILLQELEGKGKSVKKPYFLSPVDEEFIASAEQSGTKLSVAQFSISPLSKKRFKVRLQFTDFEADITETDFASIPSYMKGRSTLKDLTLFANDVIIRTFNDKYQILSQKREALKPTDVPLQSQFKAQSIYFKDQKFVTQNDIARVTGRAYDKKDKFFQMLRHLQIIRQARENSLDCVIWMKN